MVLEPPADMAADAVAVWEAVVPWLLEQGILAASDLLLLVELCEVTAWARRYRDALEQLVEHADIWAGMQRDAEGDEAFIPSDIRYPLLLGSAEAKRLRTGYLECLKRAESIASKMGLTPTDRVRLGLMRRAGAASLVEAIERAMKGPGGIP